MAECGLRGTSCVATHSTGAECLDVQTDALSRGRVDELNQNVHSAGGGGQWWGAPARSQWPMTVDARR